MVVRSRAALQTLLQLRTATANEAFEQLGPATAAVQAAQTQRRQRRDALQEARQQSPPPPQQFNDRRAIQHADLLRQRHQQVLRRLEQAVATADMQLAAASAELGRLQEAARQAKAARRLVEKKLEDVGRNERRATHRADGEQADELAAIDRWHRPQ